jgi:hypothetical protein
MLETGFREVLCSYLGRYTGYTDGVSSWFFSVPAANAFQIHRLYTIRRCMPDLRTEMSRGGYAVLSASWITGQEGQVSPLLVFISLFSTLRI